MAYRSATRMYIDDDPYPGGILKRWTGTGWVRSPMRVHVGGQWPEKPLKVWNNVEWLEVDTEG